MACTSDCPFKRASHTQTLEVTGNVPIVLVNVCEEQTCFFVIQQVKNCTRIGRAIVGYTETLVAVLEGVVVDRGVVCARVDVAPLEVEEAL